MADKPDHAAREREFRQLKSAWARLRAGRATDRERRRKQLQKRQKMERTAARLYLRGQPRSAVLALLEAVDLIHCRERRDLEDTLRAEDRSRTEQDSDVRVIVGAHIPSNWLSPVDAVARRDDAAMARWNEHVRRMSDTQFVNFIGASHAPTLHRES